MVREEGDLLIVDADADVGRGRPYPMRPGSGRPGGSRAAAVAIAGLVLLTASIAFGGMADPQTASPTPRSTPVPTNPVTGCRLAGIEQAPTFNLRDAGGDGLASGLVGSVVRPGFEVHVGDWLVPATPMLVNLPSGSILEAIDGQADCIRAITAAYAPASLAGPPGRGDWQPLVDGPVEPASASVRIGGLPDGDWVIRAAATFETGIDGPGGLVASTLFFRLQIGEPPPPSPSVDPGPTLVPTPAITPTVACGPGPGDPVEGDTAEIGFLAQASHGDPVPGAGPQDETPVIDVSPGERIEVLAAGDACATSWNLMLVDKATQQTVRTIQRRNPAEDPGFAAQNRWSIEVGFGTYALIAEANFGPTTFVHQEWQLAGRGFEIPDARLVAGDKTVVAKPGCGLNASLPNGLTTGQDCQSFELPPGLEPLVVPAWGTVTIEIPGWTILAWSGSCGQLVTDDSGSGTYLDTSKCWSLGSFGTSPNAPPPEPARFLARPGRQIVELAINATHDDVTFSVPYYAVVVGQ